MTSLIDTVPEEVKLKHKVALPEGMGEFYSLKFIEEKLSKNRIFPPERIFSPDPPFFSFIPSAVDYVSLSSELLTAYTPYQPEVSQGLLQILFEYQSMICELTGMDVSNASLYDHSTALCEAIRMALKYTERNKVLLPKYMRRERKLVVKSYMETIGVELYEYKIEKETGKIDLSDIENNLKNAACIYVENPSYFGIIDDNLPKLSDIVHKNDSLFIVGVEPISLGIIREPGSYQADIVVGDAQHLAIHPFYGGPSLGIIACREELKLIHLMPGRIVGCTTTLDGSELGFSLVLQAREQHIKREKATSNITTNQSWLAVRAAIYLALLGKEGLKRLAARILLNTQRLKKVLEDFGFISKFPRALHFRNLLMSKEEIHKIRNEMLKKGYFFGKLLSSEFEGFENSILLGVSEYQDSKSFEELRNALLEVTRNV
jgi:glycine dehydrogenase subunit 1